MNQLVSASEADPDRGFMARLMALCSLPRTNPGNRLQVQAQSHSGAAPGGVAPAGDTVEIVRVVDGRGHGHVAGVRIRASARFCAAHADNVPTRLSAARLFDGSW